MKELHSGSGIGRDRGTEQPEQQEKELAGFIERGKKTLSSIWDAIKGPSASTQSTPTEKESVLGLAAKEIAEKNPEDVLDTVMATLNKGIRACDEKFPRGSRARNVYDKISEKGFIRGIWEGTGEWRLFSLKEKLTPEFEKEHAIQAKAIHVIDAYCSLRTVISLGAIGLGTAIGFGSYAVGAAFRGVGGYALASDLREKKREKELDAILTSISEHDVKTEDDRKVLNEGLTTIQALASYLKKDMTDERFQSYREALEKRADYLDGHGAEAAVRQRDLQHFEKQRERKKQLYTVIDQSIAVGTGAFMAIVAPKIFKGLWGGIKGGWHIFSESDVGKKVIGFLEGLGTNTHTGGLTSTPSPKLSPPELRAIQKDFSGATQEYAPLGVNAHDMDQSLNPRPEQYINPLDHGASPPNIPVDIHPIAPHALEQSTAPHEWGTLKDQWSQFLEKIIDDKTNRPVEEAFMHSKTHPLRLTARQLFDIRRLASRDDFEINKGPGGAGMRLTRMARKALKLVEHHLADSGIHKVPCDGSRSVFGLMTEIWDRDHGAFGGKTPEEVYEKFLKHYDIHYQNPTELASLHEKIIAHKGEDFYYTAGADDVPEITQKKRLIRADIFLGPSVEEAGLHPKSGTGTTHELLRKTTKKIHRGAKHLLRHHKHSIPPPPEISVPTSGSETPLATPSASESMPPTMPEKATPSMAPSTTTTGSPSVEQASPSKLPATNSASPSAPATDSVK